MGAAIIERTRLPLAVGLYQEAAEVGDRLVDFLCLLLPPTLYTRIQRVGGLQIPKRLGRAEVDGQVNLDAPGAQDVGNFLYLLYIYACKYLGRGIDVVEYRAVDADGGACLGVLLD